MELHAKRNGRSRPTFSPDRGITLTIVRHFCFGKRFWVTQKGETHPFCEPIFGYLEDVTKKPAAWRDRDLSNAIGPFILLLLSFGASKGEARE